MKIHQAWGDLMGDLTMTHDQNMGILLFDFHEHQLKDDSTNE